VLAPLAAALVVVVVLVSVLASGSGEGSRVVRAQVSAPGASAWVQLSHGRAELSLVNMPQAWPGRVYEIWVKRSGPPAPTDALFSVTLSGNATVGVPGSIKGVHEVLVTSEPLGGSRTPTTSPVVIAKLA
jgi:hypothetical protein